MLFFKEKTALEKLQQHEYKDMKEKLELLEKLAEEKPSPQELVWMLAEADHKLREFAIPQIVCEQSNAMFQLLLKQLESNELGRKYIPPILARMNYSLLLPYLQKSLSSANIDERLLATEIISFFPSVDRFIPILQEAIQDPDERIRYFASNKLCTRIKNKEVFLSLLSLLNDESDRIRYKIISEMSLLNNAEIIEPFFARLPYESQELQDKIIYALTNLAKNPNLSIDKYVIPILASDEQIIRESAARLLAQMPNKVGIIRNFLLYLRGVVSWLRERIFESIAKIGPNIADAVIELLIDPDVRIDCMFLSQYISDPRVIPGVANIFQSNDVDWWIKVSALDILVKLKAPNISNLLTQYQQDSDLKWAIIGAYSDINDFSGINFLITCLNDKSQYIRLESLRALAKFKHPKADQIIRQVAETSQDVYLRDEAIRLANEKNISIVTSEISFDKTSLLNELKGLGIEMEDEALNYVEEQENEGENKKDSPPISIPKLTPPGQVSPSASSYPATSVDSNIPKTSSISTPATSKFSSTPISSTDVPKPILTASSAMPSSKLSPVADANMLKNAQAKNTPTIDTNIPKVSTPSTSKLTPISEGNIVFQKLSSQQQSTNSQVQSHQQSTNPQIQSHQQSASPQVQSHQQSTNPQIQSHQQSASPQNPLKINISLSYTKPTTESLQVSAKPLNEPTVDYTKKWFETKAMLQKKDPETRSLPPAQSPSKDSGAVAQKLPSLQKPSVQGQQQPEDSKIPESSKMMLRHNILKDFREKLKAQDGGKSQDFPNYNNNESEQ